jgi:protein O-mannosyl-transferase
MEVESDEIGKGPSEMTKRKREQQRSSGAANVGSPAAGAAKGALAPFLDSRAVQVLLVLLAGLVAYGNTLHVPFVFDDHSSIVDNPVIKNLDNFLASLDGYRYNPRRVIGYLTFALNYRFGGLDVFGYHLVNLGIHLAASLLVYTFILILAQTPYLRGSRLVPHGRPLALLCGLLFAVHPLQTQAVTYVVQRLASLASTFYLLAMVLYGAARLRQVRDGRLGSPQALLYFCGALFAALSAVHTKEIAFTLPFMLILFEALFFPATARKQTGFFLGAAVVLALGAIVVAHDPRPLGQLLSDVDASLIESSALSRTEYLFTQFRVIATYLRLLILPVSQNLDYDYPAARSLFEAPVLAAAMLLFAMIGSGLWLLKRGRTGDDPGLILPAFGIFWFFLCLAVESSIIPISDVIFEHRLYLPSVGVITAIVSLAFLFGQRVPARSAVMLGTATVVAMAVITWQRNRVWADGVTLWQDVIAKSPGKARPRNELGKVYFDQGRYPEAIAQYRAAIAITPEFLPARNNLGAAYQKSGDLDAAIAQYQFVLDREPSRTETRNNLGSAYDRKGMLDQAISEFEGALKAKPDYAAAHNNLGAAYRKKGRFDEAIAQYRAALRLKPDYASAYNNLGIAYAVMGRLDDAVQQMETALRLQPENGEFRENLAKVYDLKGMPERAAAERRTIENRGAQGTPP